MLKFVRRASSSHGSKGPVSFVANVDSYGGRIINHDDVMTCASNEVFSQRLEHSMSIWRNEGNGKGVWLEIPVEAASFVPYAIKNGFEIHHAHKDSITLTYWFPGERGVASSLPSYNTHTVGVGAAVMNEIGQLLVVQERTGPASKLKDFWKIPTGIVHAGEDSYAACEREVLEETGVHVSAQRLTAVREAHVKQRESQIKPTNELDSNANVFQTNLFFVFACKPKLIKDGQIDIIKQDHEIAKCQWMDADQFITSQERIMPPGSVYHELNRKAVLVAKQMWQSPFPNEADLNTITITTYSASSTSVSHHPGQLQGFQHRALPFRKSFNRVYDPVELIK